MTPNFITVRPLDFSQEACHNGITFQITYCYYSIVLKYTYCGFNLYKLPLYLAQKKIQIINYKLKNYIYI
jgi:hypothetical protein